MASTTNGYRPLRLLGGHERYSLARHNIGHPPILCSIAWGEANRIEEIREVHQRLHERIKIILQSIPIFSAHIPDQYAMHPIWARHDTKSEINTNQILSPIQDLEEDQDGLSFDDAEGLLQQFQLFGKHTLQDLTKPPFWRVRLLMKKEGESIRFAVVLILHHLVLDGQGMMNLFVSLIQSKEHDLPPRDELRGSLVSGREDDVKGSSLPLTSDITMRSRAPVLWIGWTWIKSKLLSVLPTFLQKLLGYHTVWPHQIRPRRKVAELTVHYRLVDIRSEDIGLGRGLFERMKEVANLHELKTVHPILHTACIFALYSHLQYTQQSFPLRAKINSAASERDVKMYGLIAGNYVSLYSFPLLLKSNMRIWDIAQSFASGLTSKAGLQMRARTWSLMPDVLGRLGEFFHRRTKQFPTPWETFFGKQAEQDQPCKSSLGFSNLGLVKLTDPLFTKIVWTQYPPIGEAIMVDGNGWRTKDGREGLSLSCGIRGNGNWGPTRGKGEDVFVNALRDVLCLMAKNEVQDEDSLEDIRNRIQVQKEEKKKLKRMKRTTIG